MLKKATELGTVCANTFNEDDGSTGISIGVYGIGNVATIEAMNGEYVLLINDSEIEKCNVKVLHTNADWNVKEITI